MIVTAGGPSLDDLFVKRLKRIDERLDMQWSAEPERWLMVYDKGSKDFVNMFLIETEDHQYRHPDNRDLVRIRVADLATKSAEKRFKESAEYMAEARIKDREDAKENIRLMTLDGKIQLMQKFAQAAGYSKGNSAFRRIKAKARGEIY